ncbi:MAG: hypothetical protein AWU57_341 [Marinobacter sp. T13-3]|nr:MAG: hypothetical protein AWU57_341 [Marinobacter sp. T13-3]
MPMKDHDNPMNAHPELYVLQDSRSIADHQTLFWAKDGKGYTTDLNQAHLFTEDEAAQQHAVRKSDIPHRVADLVEGMRLTIEDTMLNHASYIQRTSLLNNLASVADLSTDPIEKELAAITYHKIQEAGPDLSAFEARTWVRESGLPLDTTKSSDTALNHRASHLRLTHMADNEFETLTIPDDDEPTGPSPG